MAQREIVLCSPVRTALGTVALAVMRETGLREEAVNPEGGAIAHGHPIGASGAVLPTRLLHGMARAGQRRGLVTLRIGGGPGIALRLGRIA
jgi:acetyl-CoA C-acetyltransferase